MTSLLVRLCLLNDASVLAVFEAASEPSVPSPSACTPSLWRAYGHFAVAPASMRFYDGDS